LLGSDILCFRSDKAPDFIALESAHTDVANVLIVELGAGRANVHKQLGNGINGNVRKATARTKAVSLNQHPDDLYTLRKWQPIHIPKHSLSASNCQA
jgi:hypothetical protein